MSDFWKLLRVFWAHRRTTHFCLVVAVHYLRMAKADLAQFGGTPSELQTYGFWLNHLEREAEQTRTIYEREVFMAAGSSNDYYKPKEAAL